MASGMKILIAYDGSDCSDAALGDLKRAGLPREAEALVVSVAESWMPSVATQLGAALATAAEPLFAPDEGARSLALAAGLRLQTAFPGWGVRAEAITGSPAPAILRKCDEWRPDLLVVGSHGRSAIGRFVLGSVSQKVMTEAHCSVRIARARESADTGAPARVLFGFDGSIDAREAARVVASRSWPEKSLVRVLAVLAPSVSESPLFPWTPEQVARREADAREWMQGRLASIELELRSAGLAAEAALTVGAPAQTILEEAEGWGADCLFIGARGLNRLVRFLLGSVATAVAARARCSVEVVRDGRRA